jgi:hypothetical protein
MPFEKRYTVGYCGSQKTINLKCGGIYRKQQISHTKFALRTLNTYHAHLLFHSQLVPYHDPRRAAISFKSLYRYISYNIPLAVNEQQDLNII